MKTKVLFVVGILLIGVLNSAFSQSIIQSETNKSSITVKGTSSLHDWKMDSEKFNCAVTIKDSDEKLIISDVSFSCNPTSLKSESSMMDKKAWDALDAKDFTLIKFESKQQFDLKATTKRTEGKLEGDLLLKGTKKSVSIPYAGEIDQNGNFIVKGDVDLKMSDFGITPPTAIMGTLKTGDNVTISFLVVFDQKNLLSFNK
jgi:polyisoprenoid-binding protein YceI